MPSHKTRKLTYCSALVVTAATNVGDLESAKQSSSQLYEDTRS